MRVTISGIDGSGKSVFAGRLLEDSADRGVRFTLLRVDDYRRKVAWAQPDRSEAEIFYEDYFDFAAIDAAVRAAAGLVVVEGIFTGRVPSLADAFAVFLDVDEEVARRRILGRDTLRGRTPEEVRHLMDQRYFPAQRRYREELQPAARAHLLIDNNDLMHPRVVRGAIDAAPAVLRASLEEVLA